MTNYWTQDPKNEDTTLCLCITLTRYIGCAKAKCSNYSLSSSRGKYLNLDFFQLLITLYLHLMVYCLKSFNNCSRIQRNQVRVQQLHFFQLDFIVTVNLTLFFFSAQTICHRINRCFKSISVMQKMQICRTVLLKL